jgi:hypothetical protein
VLNYSPRRARSDRGIKPFIIVCAWCRERQLYGNSWGPRTVAGDESNLSHGICPECFGRERAKLDAKPEATQPPRR